MAVPVYLSSMFKYHETPDVQMDIADMIAVFRDQVLNKNSPQWTEPSANLFRSPPDEVGRWFDVLLTRIGATNMEMRYRTPAALVICTQRMQLPAGGSVVRIYSGQFHYHVEAASSGEFVRGGILDLSPEAQNIHGQWAWAKGYRNANDLVDSYSTWPYAFANDGNVVQEYERGCSWGGADNNLRVMMSPSGGYIFAASGFMVAPSNGADSRFAGRKYQHIIGPDQPAGAEFIVPIDANTFGTFKCLGGMNASNGSKEYCRIA